MEDGSRLKLILVGIFLGSLALGYFIFSQKVKIDQNQTSKVVITPSPSATPTTLGTTTSTVAKSGQQLPATGVPVALIGIFAASAMISGFFLRKFPK